ncbi:ubiquitin protein ligase [Reticulomyxa filosa]|uniref:Ubiquitin protein ligase n=1 Tax=Reticulomyxa filosa TaxID=46433 RepID=X6NKA1_RETFI|nr:ubiquitin protein ligase [Reticulomyxa filosa]|eukprot:ETO26164.1 ubiquitin protein ligase [Reticulomyxa filosa]
MSIRQGQGVPHHKSDERMNSYLENIHLMVLEQLDKISQINPGQPGSWVPQLPPEYEIKFAKKKEKEDVLMSRKVATVSTYGIATAAATGLTEEAEDEEEDTDVLGNSNNVVEQTTTSEESFHVRVLNLVEELCETQSNITGKQEEEEEKKEDSKSLEKQSGGYTALDLFSKKRGLSALLRLLWNGSPRTRVVTLRILRHVLASHNAPQWKLLDECDNAKRSGNGDDEIQSMFISRLLQDIGRVLCAPIFACYFDGKQDSSAVSSTYQKLWEYMSNMNLPLLYSSDFVSVCAEEIMLLRHLLRKATTSWQSIIGSTIQKSLHYLAKQSKNLDIGDELLQCVGALGLLGGYVDNIRVGSRVYYAPEDVIAVAATQEVVALGDEPFDVTNFPKSIQWSKIMEYLVGALSWKSEAGQFEVFKDKIDVMNVLCLRIQSLCGQALNGLLLNGDLLQLFMQSFASNGVKVLTDIAFTRTHHSCEVPTSVLCDRGHILTNESLRRSRKYEAVELSIEHTAALNVRVKKPNVEFLAEFTCLGKHLEQHHQGVTGLSESTKGSVKGLLSYIQLNEEPTVDKCRNKIVMIDTYGKFKARLRKAKEFGAIAVILALHSKKASSENLQIKAEIEKKPKKSTKPANATNVVELATQSAIMDLNPTRNRQIRTERSLVGSGFEVRDDISSAMIEDSTLTTTATTTTLKKDDKAERNEADDIEAIKNLILNRQMMIQELIKTRGHSKQLAKRALKKDGNTTIEAADAWIKANKEWLLQTIEIEEEKQKEQKIQEAKRSKTTSADQLKMVSLEELTTDQNHASNQWNLAEKWKDFEDATLRNLASGSSTQVSTQAGDPWGNSSSTLDFFTRVDEYDNVEPNAASKEWFNIMIYQPTHDLLYYVLATDHALCVHAIRRALLSLFIQVSLHNIVTPKEFEQILHICLSLRPHPAAELDAVNSMKPMDITGRLVRCLRDEQAKSDGDRFYLNTLMSCAQSILRNLCTNRQVFRKKKGKKGTDDPSTSQDGDDMTTVKRLIAPVHGRTNRHGGYNSREEEARVKALLYEWPGTEKLKLIVAGDPSLTNMGTTCVSVFQDPNKKKLIAKFIVTPFDFTRHVQVIEGNKFYYTVTSTSWYTGCPPAEVTFTVMDLSSDFGISESEVLEGTIYSALVFINAMLVARVISLDIVLLQLLRSLEHAMDRKAAQAIARIATCIANQWHFIPRLDNKQLSDNVITLIDQSIDHLETSHEGLRLWTLTQWSSGSLPGPHIQTLLELLLAVRSVIPKQSKEKSEHEEKETKSENDEQKTGVKKVPENVVKAFAKHRDGPSKCTIITLMYEKVMSSRTLSTKPDPHNRYFIDDFVANVSVRGGKWYFECKFTGQCNYACVGVIARNYRKRSNNGISNDDSGNSWCVTGPKTTFMHRNRSIQPIRGDSGDFARPNWGSGIVIGVKLNLDDKFMEFTFDGLPSGNVFSGIECEEGLFPCVSLNQNSQCVINMGLEEFAFPPNPNEGYVPFEHAGILSSSWLNRYQLASDVTMFLTKRATLPDNIVDSALTGEASLEYSHKMRFEVVKSNAIRGANADTILQDNTLSARSTKPENTNITFKVPGHETVEFLLRGVNVRCPTSVTAFKMFVFVGNNDPDFDSFEWCRHWDQKAFDSFESRKRATNATLRKPHEPVGFMENTGSTGYIKLTPPVAGKFVTLKFVARDRGDFGSLSIEYISFDCIHGSHPLASLIGDHERAVKRRAEIIHALKGTIQAKCGNWSLPMDEALTEMSQMVATRLGVEVTTLDAVMLIPNKDDVNRFKRLITVESEELQGRFAIVKYLNKLVTPLLHYIDVTLFADDEENGTGTSSLTSFATSFLSALARNQTSQGNRQSGNSSTSPPSAEESKRELTMELVPSSSLSSQIYTLKGCYFMSTKKSVFDTLLSSSCVFSQRNRPRISINRIKAARARENKNDPTGLKSTFGQLFSQLKNIRYSTFRGISGQQLWNVQFIGEGSTDIGGPYRESLTNAISDLQSDAVPLFILSPNGRNSVGLNREKWIPNPSCTSSLHLSMYEFVGVLMGIALRTKQTLGFDLPSIVWKQLLPDEKVDITDLEAIDKLCVQALNELEKIDEKSFNYVVYERFTTQLSDGTEIELKENGKSIDVTKKNLSEFVSLVIKKRLNEASEQLKSIAKGLNQVVPARMLSLFSWYDLEILVCGNPNIDVEALRRHTVYQGGLSSSSDVVKFFWKTLYAFSQEERQLFLRFVWGRNRLPLTENDWHSNFAIKALNTNEDSLPIAHTCFFSIDLPPYSSFELCRDKLRFAIHNCQAIDIDFDPTSSSLQAWVDDF